MQIWTSLPLKMTAFAFSPALGKFPIFKLRTDDRWFPELWLPRAQDFPSSQKIGS